ncbi:MULTISPECIES: FAS1-like dehydratase domain-containing protein [Nocardia]|uniref:FAS1-like dehydratase domain-containing protein n=1 Tax=Nocardia TaxID=1817 RepID=UPI001894BC85|nr:MULTISPECIES: MaoC family dehydratase N-terminal domain-containing protein [Nocardia]MBF6347926.1 MaoC family dehydratase N-terminal domain-containing protein [Nocardia flavorosea]
MSSDEIAKQIQRMIDSGGSRTSVARDPVNRPMIHHLCDALGDRNPVYLSPESAAAAGHTDVVAPPGALQVWNMLPPGDTDASAPSEVERAYDLLRHGGFPNVVAVNCEQEYIRYLVPGDVLTCEEKVEHISEPKTTKLGPGYFITTLTTYTDQESRPVGSMRFRTLWYASTPEGAGDE